VQALAVGGDRLDALPGVPTEEGDEAIGPAVVADLLRRAGHHAVAGDHHLAPRPKAPRLDPVGAGLVDEAELGVVVVPCARPTTRAASGEEQHDHDEGEGETTHACIVPTRP
jgi:hypothetical protein